ncbi:hypothetical protein PUN28_002766 [Cardiocondyla obscurior]|uniref:Uncharacterized protein n=1 Tax=Cardiocondyla obscurior TaxID=286306 RepID=A0AAW2GW48_9HYME
MYIPLRTRSTLQIPYQRDLQFKFTNPAILITSPERDFQVCGVFRRIYGLFHFRKFPLTINQQFRGTARQSADTFPNEKPSRTEGKFVAESRGQSDPNKRSWLAQFTKRRGGRVTINAGRIVNEISSVPRVVREAKFCETVTAARYPPRWKLDKARESSIRPSFRLRRFYTQSAGAIAQERLIPRLFS